MYDNDNNILHTGPWQLHDGNDDYDSEYDDDDYDNWHTSHWLLHDDNDVYDYDDDDDYWHTSP